MYSPKQQDYAALFTPEQVAAIRHYRRVTADAESTRQATAHTAHTIEHTDRQGNAWRFTLDCTLQQANSINEILAGFRVMGGRQLLTITGILNADDNARFYADLENVFLSALSQRFPHVPAQPQAVTSESEPAADEQGPATIAAATAATTPAAVQEKQKTYWWDDD